jgi:hypothetical protein
VRSGNYRHRCSNTVAIPTRIAEVAARRLVEKFSRGETPPEPPTVSTDGDDVVLTLDGDAHRLDRETVRRLRDDLDEALTRRREFLHTAGVRREDGTYVVERRGADSAGHRKVFDDPADLRRLYDRLPERFTAADVTAAGVSGPRRHLLVRHVAEHPGFDCDLAARQPLTVQKDASGADGDAAATAGDPGEVTVAGPADADD